MGPLVALYGVVAYALFLFTFCYAAGFVGNLVVPKSIDVGVPPGAAGEPVALAALVNVALLGLFAVQHSVMARPAFKRWWTDVVPPSMERSTFVLMASAALLFLFTAWRPIGAVVWDASGTVTGTALTALFALGWALVLASTFQIDHFELFGVRQVWWRLRGLSPEAPRFRVPLFYRAVRHPIYLGFIVAFWSTPRMTVGHLLFAAVTTGYVLVGIWFEERDLIAQFGERYRAYRERVGMLWPRLGRRTTSGSAQREQAPRV